MNLHLSLKSPASAAMAIALLAACAFAACQIASAPLTTNVMDSLLGDEGYVRISPGSFLMGSPAQRKGVGKSGFADDVDGRERPQHCVTISRPFELGKYEVNQEQWQAVMGSNPSAFKGPGLPATNVSWHDVQEFIKRLQALDPQRGYRLPTEAEWEYACRAGSTGDFAGEADNHPEAEGFGKNPAAMAWFADNSLNRPHPAGQMKPNAWGLFDMHGNVREWCQDWYDVGYYKQDPADDPQGPAEGTMKVNRGGSWQSPALMCRSAARGYDLPTERNNLIGFRLVRVKKHLS
jgi:formylglycine-generating enzyme required for sulfatase activity